MTNDTITIIGVIIIAYMALNLSLHFISNDISELKRELRELKKEKEGSNNENK